MLENIKGVALYIFGTNKKDVFHRVIIFILVIVVATNLILNVSCGINSDGKFYFQWKPVDVKVELKK